MRIGLVPMAAKPYHAGHHALVKKAASQNDEVIVYVSTSDRKRKGQLPIMGADMQKIWREQIENILPGNVTPVYGGSPVRKVYEELKAANEKALDGTLENIYTVYSDPTDTAQNYSEENRQKHFPSAYAEGHVKFAAEEDPEAFTRGVGTPDISGTAVREFIRCGDFESFVKTMPKGLDARSVYDTLCPLSPTNESYLRTYISEFIRG
jgi:cytidyltransferase-like protein